MKRIRTILRALDPKAAATMSRRERTEAFRIRRSVVAWILALCVIVSCTSCSVHAVLVNAVLNGHAKTAQIGNSGTHSEKTDQSAKSEKKSQQSEKKTQESSETKDAKASAEETAEPQEDAVTKALREQSAALMDDQKSEILAKAQQTAQNNGYGMVQYHYCVVTNGEVGSVEDFSNAVFRILNSEHGWARAGAIFEPSTDGNCDFDIVLAQASTLPTFSSVCSEQYSCRVGNNVIINDDRWNSGTDVWMSGGGDLARYRTMVINHEVGHRLGHIDNEMTCAGAGQAAPLMQEQPIFLDGCAINEYPLDSELWIG